MTTLLEQLQKRIDILEAENRLLKMKSVDADFIANFYADKKNYSPINRYSNTALDTDTYREQGGHYFGGKRAIAFKKKYDGSVEYNNVVISKTFTPGNSVNIYSLIPQRMKESAIKLVEKYKGLPPQVINNPEEVIVIAWSVSMVKFADTIVNNKGNYEALLSTDRPVSVYWDGEKFSIYSANPETFLPDMLQPAMPM